MLLWQHHLKYMVLDSGAISNDQLALYFANAVSAETLYETKIEPLFACSIPRRSFLPEPNKDQFIPRRAVPRWRWSTKHGVPMTCSFANCDHIEYALENEHDSVVLALSDCDGANENAANGENADPNHEAVVNRRHLVFDADFARKNKNLSFWRKQSAPDAEHIELDSETFHRGVVTDELDVNHCFIRSSEWKACHRFALTHESRRTVTAQDCDANTGSFNLQIKKRF